MLWVQYRLRYIFLELFKIIILSETRVVMPVINS